MSTMATWFASATQARQAVLDLLTGGVPRQNISVVVPDTQAAPADASYTQPQADGDAERAMATAGAAHDFVAALIDTRTATLAGIGPIVVAGPIAEALAASTDVHSALSAIDIPDDQVRMYAERLHNGGALVAVHTDGAWQSVVQGVFLHNADPVLREQDEQAAFTPASDLEADEPEEPTEADKAAEAERPLSTSVGALTGGLASGSWGPADVLAADDEDLQAPPKPPAE